MGSEFLFNKSKVTCNEFQIIKKPVFILLVFYFQVLAFKLIMDQVRITGSATGGMKITQECINFMAEKNIMVKTEMINTFDEMNAVTEKLVKGNDSGLRYVIDMEKIFC